MSLSKDEIRKLLAQIPTIEHQQDFRFQYLADGITNENYWIKIDNAEYVLRINNPESQRLGLDRDNEVSVLKKVASLKLSTETVYYHKHKTFRLSKWLPGEVWNRNQLEKQVNLNRLAQRLKQLHSLPHQNFPVLDLLERLELYRKMVEQRLGRLPVIEQRLLSEAIKLVSTMQNTMPSCLCHNDLIAANILDTNIQGKSTICFLDWEYAAVIEPLFELAVICQGNQLSLSSQQYLLQAYLGNQAGHLIDSFANWCWFYDYLSLLWGFVILPADLPYPENLNELLENLFDTIPRR